MQLSKRVAALEGGSGGPVRIVWREAWQSDAEALDTYGRDRISASDKVVLVSWDGENDAT